MEVARVVAAAVQHQQPTTAEDATADDVVSETSDGDIDLGRYLYTSNGEATQDGPATAKNSRRSRARSG